MTMPSPTLDVPLSRPEPLPATVPALARELLQRIETRRATVGVVGLGYVGLPLALSFGSAGFRVVGIDVDRERVASLGRGRSHVTDVADGELLAEIQADRFHPTSDWKALAGADVVAICVPTPLRKTKDPDLTYIVAATEQVAAHLRPGQLVVLESTTYPGTTEEVVMPKLEEAGLRLGRDVFLAFSPERVDPGNLGYRTRDIPKVVGGATPTCTALAAALYGSITQVVPVSCPRVAEMVKLLENTFRSVNIALVNEMAMMCSHMGIDVWEVIAGAATKPFGFMPFYPGPGLGGHCIPIDPIYLQWRARLMGFDPQFIELAQRINGDMPRFVARRAMELLNECGKPVRGARILVLGVTYKRNVNDVRESPALPLMRELQAKGAELAYSDPHVPALELAGHELRSQPVGPAALACQDLVIIVTDHAAFDYQGIVQAAPLVLDTRNATAPWKAPHVRKL